MTSYSVNGAIVSISDRSVPASPEPGSNSTPDVAAQNAPTYTIPNTEIAAVEIPAVVQDIDRAIKAFGRLPSFEHVGYLFAIYLPMLMAALDSGPSAQLVASLFESREPILQSHHVP